MDTSKRFRTAKKWLAIVAALLILCTILMWGIGTAWGNVKADRISIIGNGGEKYAALQLTPVGVNADNPAPAVIVNHGGSNSAFSEVVYGIEYARRGYVVIMCDQINAGESVLGAESTAVNLLESWIDFALSQQYIDGIVETGLSKGGLSIAQLINDGYAEKINGVVTIVSRMASENIENYPIGTNYLEIAADADGYDAEIYSGHAAEGHLDILRSKLNISNYEYGNEVGSYKDGTYFNSIMVRSVHGFCYLYPSTHIPIHEFLSNVLPTGTNIAHDDLIYPSWLFINGICCALFVTLGITLAYTLTLAPGFATIIHTKRTVCVEKTRKQRVIQVAMDLIVPFLLYGLVTPLMSKLTFLGTNVFKCTAINSTILWLFSTAIFSLCVFLFRNKKEITMHSVDCALIGTGENGNTKLFDKSKIYNALIIAIITTAAMFAWINIVISITGFNYQINGFAFFSRMNLERFIRAIPYLVVIIFIVFMINVSIATSRRLKDTGNESLDTAKNIVFNILISIIPLCVLMFCYFGVGYIRGNGVPLLPTAFNTSMNTVIAFPFMMGSSVGISAFLYRKTGNIWTGVFVASFILGLFTLSAPGFVG